MNPNPDPFADEAAEEAADADAEGDNVTKGKAYVHVRVQQRNGRKSLTTVQVCTAASSNRVGEAWP